MLVGTRRTAQAHTVTNVGDYAIIVGWVNEPPVVGVWNTMYVDIFNQEEELDASAVQLRQLELVSGEITRPTAPSRGSSGETVRYAVSFMPTAVGATGAHIIGTLDGEPLDVTVFPEPVEAANIAQFPDVALSNGDLQTGLIRLEDQLAAQQTQMVIAYVVGGAGLLIGAAGLAVALQGRRKA